MTVAFSESDVITAEYLEGQRQILERDVERMEQWADSFEYFFDDWFRGQYPRVLESLCSYDIPWDGDCGSMMGRACEFFPSGSKMQAVEQLVDDVRIRSRVTGASLVINSPASVDILARWWAVVGAGFGLSVRAADWLTKGWANAIGFDLGTGDTPVADIAASAKEDEDKPPTLRDWLRASGTVMQVLGGEISMIPLAVLDALIVAFPPVVGVLVSGFILAGKGVLGIYNLLIPHGAELLVWMTKYGRLPLNIRRALSSENGTGNSWENPSERLFQAANEVVTVENGDLSLVLTSAVDAYVDPKGTASNITELDFAEDEEGSLERNMCLIARRMGLYARGVYLGMARGAVEWIQKQAISRDEYLIDNVALLPVVLYRLHSLVLANVLGTLINMVGLIDGVGLDIPSNLSGYSIGTGYFSGVEGFDNGSFPILAGLPDVKIGPSQENGLWSQALRGVEALFAEERVEQRRQLGLRGDDLATALIENQNGKMRSANKTFPLSPGQMMHKWRCNRF